MNMILRSLLSAILLACSWDVGQRYARAATSSHSKKSNPNAISNSSADIATEALAPRSIPSAATGEECEQYSPLYAAIDQDLSLWARDGISLELMQHTIAHKTTRILGKQGFAAAWHGGKVYIVDEPTLGSVLRQHAGLFSIYIRMLLHLEKMYGHLIPDSVGSHAGVAESPRHAALVACTTYSQSCILRALAEWSLRIAQPSTC